MMNHKARATAMVCGVLVSLTGCGGGGELPTAPAHGTVMIDGKPLAGARLAFVPEQGRGATAHTTSDGSFALSTYDEGDGAVLGKHRVTITAREPGKEDMKGSPLLPRPGRSLIPESYSSTDTSGLEFEVVAGQDNTFQIQLTSQHIR